MLEDSTEGAQDKQAGAGVQNEQRCRCRGHRDANRQARNGVAIMEAFSA